MKLSIITINFNNKEGLAKTIKSVITQTTSEIEYLVIDGGSSDGSIEIIEEYQDRINYWVSEPDRGIYHAMNKGIAKAQGEYCQFLNSGDSLVSPDTTSLMLSQLNSSSIVYGNLIKHWSNGRTYRNTSIAVDSLFTFYSGTLNHACTYLKRSLFDIYGRYDESLKIVADWKFYLIAIGMNGETVQYIDVDVVNFDMGGISNQQKSIEKAERSMVLQEVLPANLLRDFERYYKPIRQYQRIARYNWAQKMLWFLDRLLFQWEKFSKD
ncbi:glycosyltransferase family 2 protein [Spirosoma panaciterrae]|uniref:glycosyltransferase family 2 protein n=1 Tax=Spirosoma panaciterrae TaxID=496058 RepID=UPI0003813FA7|nr:glycosyltransferase family 2 protein [Spirosoma panaciterrae]